MTKLHVNLNNDLTEVSSVSLPGIRKLLVRAQTGKKSLRSYHKRYCLPCEVHDHNSASVVLDAYRFLEGASEEERFVGKARICFMCWRLIELLKK